MKATDVIHNIIPCRTSRQCHRWNNTITWYTFLVLAHISVYAHHYSLSRRSHFLRPAYFIMLIILCSPCPLNMRRPQPSVTFHRIEGTGALRASGSSMELWPVTLTKATTTPRPIPSARVYLYSLHRTNYPAFVGIVEAPLNSIIFTQRLLELAWLLIYWRNLPLSGDNKYIYM